MIWVVPRWIQGWCLHLGCIGEDCLDAWIQGFRFRACFGGFVLYIGFIVAKVCVGEEGVSLVRHFYLIGISVLILLVVDADQENWNSWGVWYV